MRRAVFLLPFLAGALIPVHSVLDAEPLCPFREITGLPCPLCGATRAFVLVAHLDGRWISYGAVWVVAALAFVVVRRVTFARVVAVALVAWAWALIHAPAIVAAAPGR